MLILRIKWTIFCLHISLAETNLDSKIQMQGTYPIASPMTITVSCLADKLINSQVSGVSKFT